VGESILSEIPKSEYNIFRTPSLRRLSLSQSSGDCLDYPVNWANLTDLAIEGDIWEKLSLHQAVYLLSQCPQLVRCSLEIWMPEGPPISYSPFTLFNLKCFSIFEGVDVTGMFSCLNLPALREVEYHTSFAPNPHKKPSLLTLLRKSNRSVQKLTTDPKRFIMKHPVIECLQFIPEATTLTLKPSRLRLDNGWFDPTVLDKNFLYSFLPSASDSLCPKLKFLEINSPLNFSSQDLLVFIFEKQSDALSDISKLERIKIVFPHTRKEDIMPHLTEFVQEGLDIQLIYAEPLVMATFSPLRGLPTPIWA